MNIFMIATACVMMVMPCWAGIEETVDWDKHVIVPCRYKEGKNHHFVGLIAPKTTKKDNSFLLQSDAAEKIIKANDTCEIVFDGYALPALWQNNKHAIWVKDFPVEGDYQDGNLFPYDVDKEYFESQKRKKTAESIGNFAENIWDAIF